MENLAIKNRDEFTIYKDGRAFISLNKLAEICNVTTNDVLSIYSGDNFKKYVLMNEISLSDILVDSPVAWSIIEGCEKEIAKGYDSFRTVYLIKTLGIMRYIFNECGFTITSETQIEALQKQVEDLQSILVALEKHINEASRKYR